MPIMVNIFYLSYTFEGHPEPESAGTPKNHSLLRKNILDFTIPDHETSQPVIKRKIMAQKIHPRGCNLGDFFSSPSGHFFKKKSVECSAHTI